MRRPSIKDAYELVIRLNSLSKSQHTHIRFKPVMYDRTIQRPKQSYVVFKITTSINCIQNVQNNKFIQFSLVNGNKWFRKLTLTGFKSSLLGRPLMLHWRINLYASTALTSLNGKSSAPMARMSCTWGSQTWTNATHSDPSTGLQCIVVRTTICENDCNTNGSRPNPLHPPFSIEIQSNQFSKYGVSYQG